MAGFLRKKSKQDPTIKVAALPVTFSSPTAPPPLFARFATTAPPSNNAISQRMVSAPIPLASHGRKESYKGGPGKSSTTSLIAGGRDVENARRKMQEQAQALVDYPASPSQFHQTKARPVSVDKPLPLPANAEPTSPPMGRRVTAAHSPGPPPVFQTNQALKGARSRASIDMQEYQSKPLPRAGSVQNRIRSPPPSNYTAVRNASVSGSLVGPNGVRNILQQQQRPSTTDEVGFPTRILSPNQDGSRSAYPTQIRPQQTGTPMSDRVVDLPPEFALFQEFSETIPLPEASQHRPPPSSLKSTGQVPSSDGPRSSIYTESYRNALKPQPSLPRANPPTPRRSISPPLPPPPTNMGISASHTAATELLPSSYKDFHGPHVLTSTNDGNATYTNVGDVIRQVPTQVRNRSKSPPLPPGAALPANFQQIQRHNQDAIPARAKPLPSFQQPSPQPPPVADPRPQMGQSQSLSMQDSLRKSSGIQPPSTPLRGKPRIFAAMEAQESESGNMSEVQQPLPQLSQQFYDQQPQQPSYHSLPNPSDVSNEQNPERHLGQPQPHLLPSVELKTPKSHLDPLPNHLPNTFEADLPPSSVYKPPPSPPKPSFLEELPVPQAEAVLRTPRSGTTRSLPKHDEVRQQPASPQSAPRSRKLSKPRHPEMPMSSHSQMNGNGASTNGSSASEAQSKSSHHTRHRTPSKVTHPSTPISLHKAAVSSEEPVVQLDEATIRKAGIPLDDDPFARVEGVVLLKPTTPPPATKEGIVKQHRGKGSLKGVSSESVVDDVGPNDAAQTAAEPKENNAPMPLTPVSPEEHRQSRKERKGGKSRVVAPAAPVENVVQQPSEPREPFTLVQFIADPNFLSLLLAFLSFYDWCILSAISKEIRILLVRTATLREVVLESYLKTVGYSRWQWNDQEPLSLSLQDLSDYMRGVSTPTHEYARVAAMHIHSLTIHPNHRDPSLAETVRALTASTRAYNRVLLRLRAQAEKEASTHSASPSYSSPPSASTSATRANGNFSPARGGTASRVSSRAPSPTTSMYSHSHGNGQASSAMQPASSQSSLTFRSPLFRLRRAPLLRVFVPSPEGDWLSDKSVLECEAECKRAGIAPLMRLGDVVWDVAVGDEGNVGRLVWDGSYLIDLDYTYSAIGELPKYLPTLAFPPSYFHRVIRTGPIVSNPIIHVDISPWGEEIAMNLQLLQDRVRTETPQGAYHNVVRWVHRSSFTIKPPRGPPRHASSIRGTSSTATRILIPNSNNLFVDPGWYGTIVVETEGTNEALADLQDRCGPGAFPPRPRGVNGHVTQAQIENRKVFRILREKSRPGEIWMRTVDVKERLL